MTTTNATTTFQAKQHVCVKGSTAVAEFVELLDNGYAKVEWLDKGGGKWKTEYPLNEVTAVGSRRQRHKLRHLQQEAEAPTNRKKVKLDENDFGNKQKHDRTKEKTELDDDTVTTELTADETVASAENSASSATKARTDEASASVPNEMIESMENEQEESDAKPAATTRKYSRAPDLWQVIGLEKDQGLGQVAKLLPEGNKKCAEQVIHFFLFCYERQMVWERRNRDERNDDECYTESWAMQDYFFCNNYRELDRGTCYFREQILKLWDKHQRDGHVDHQTWIELVLWATICYRLVNRISTFAEFGGIPSRDEWPNFRAFLQAQKRAGTVIFTGAHQTASIKQYIPNMNKLWKNDGKLVKKFSKEILECCEDESDEILERCFNTVQRVDGIAEFLAWQVTCDLHESQCLAGSTENDWTELGPGARSGIDLIFSKSGRDKETYLELAVCLQTIQDDVYDALGLEFPKWNGSGLTLKNIEHPLCEFSKYTVIQGNLRRGCFSFSGKRLNNSRTDMDIEKSCHYVEKCGEHDDILLCDKCLVGFCNACAGPRAEASDYWVCPRCAAFESQRRAQHGD